MISCLNCEGKGTVREYINVAGDHYVWHCPVCKGIGTVDSALLKLKPVPAPYVPKPRDPNKKSHWWNPFD